MRQTIRRRIEALENLYKGGNINQEVIEDTKKFIMALLEEGKEKLSPEAAKERDDIIKSINSLINPYDIVDRALNFTAKYMDWTEENEWGDLPNNVLQE